MNNEIYNEDNWEPKWIKYSIQSFSSYQGIDHNGMLFRQGISYPSQSIDIPENLLDDIESKAINPFNYTREDLRLLSYDRYRRELDILELTSELPIITDDMVRQRHL